VLRTRFSGSTGSPTGERKCRRLQRPNVRQRRRFRRQRQEGPDHSELQGHRLRSIRQSLTRAVPCPYDNLPYHEGVPDTYGKRQRENVKAKKAAAKEERRIARNQRREAYASGTLGPREEFGEPNQTVDDTPPLEATAPEPTSP
jgi:hypothetical protein